MKNLFILMLLMAGFAQAQQPANPDGAVELNAKTFRERSAAEANAVILDVRTPDEVREGIVPGAQVIDFQASDFAARIGKLDKNKPYFVYCKSGGRSSRTVDLMKSTGFKHVHALEGGYMEWTRAGYPVKKP
ncbi:MAG TPA: rhodanese-like domain-containing protein [Chryseolinea sp.]|nr:rhodanese-like domain-containing protein [Chryseolinea sp.]